MNPDLYSVNLEPFLSKLVLNSFGPVFACAIIHRNKPPYPRDDSLDHGYFKLYYHFDVGHIAVPNTLSDQYIFGTGKGRKPNNTYIQFYPLGELNQSFGMDILLDN